MDDVILWSGDPADAAAWHSNAADGSSVRLSVEPNPGGAALRVDFSLAGHGAWGIVRRDVRIALPAHYVARLTVRGSGDPCELQLKFVDASGANVWWWRRAGFVPPTASTRLNLRKAALEFAWGPASGGDPRQLGAVELALAAEHASGTLWIEALRVEARDPTAAHPRVVSVRASSARAAHAAENVCVSDETSSWRPEAQDARPHIDLDLGRPSEFGGVVVDFAAPAPACRLFVSDDGSRWSMLAESPAAAGHRCWLRTADGDGRFARVELGADAAVTHADVVPLELAVSPSRYIAAIAHDQPRGRFPRHLLGEQAYWAVVGADGDARKGLLSEDGALEVDAEAFTLEPFLWVDGRMLSWADAESTVSLAEEHLPVPSVEWRTAGVRLHVTAAAAGEAGRSVLVVRYRITHDGGAARAVRLFVAVRPFQVNPSWQSLNLVGGVAPITRLQCAAAEVRVNDARAVVAVSTPAAVGAARSEIGLAALSTGAAPSLAQVDDPIGFAEAAFAFDRELAPGEASSVIVAVPLWSSGTAGGPPADSALAAPHGLDPAAAAAWGEARIAETIAGWRHRLAEIPIELPPCAAAFAQTLRASLGWILVNRDGPRIQPGPRCYRRSWIRDGTLTGTALAEMGLMAEAPAFLRWYAPYQLADGRVPCAVDHRGIDQAVEHDSHGQLIWGVVETFRLSGDEALLRELWPHLLRAVDAIAALRATRTTEAYRGNVRFGLLPESISHEGYASNPAHSYWDDFFAVRALADATDAAVVLGDGDAATRIAALCEAMRADVQASIARSIATHRIDFIPGAAELGDFDPTSTAIALDPCGTAALLPPAALARTFERYWAELEARRQGNAPNEAYTPYEVRIGGALVMLGQGDRARELLEWLIADQRLPPWRQWPEIAWRDRRAPRFFGDLPHGWVASSLVRAVRRLLAYEDRDRQALVLAAGIPDAWVREAPGVRARNLPTHFGRLDMTMCAVGDAEVRVTLGDRLRWPRGGVVVTSPRQSPLREVVIDGVVHPPTDPHRVALTAPAADVRLRY